MPESRRFIDGDDLAFERRWWAFQRVGWVGLAALLVLAAGGLFGNGLFTRTTKAAGGVTLEYPRFARSGASLTIEITTDAGRSSFLLDDHVLAFLVPETIVPAPARQFATSEGLNLIYEPATTRVRIAGRSRSIGAERGVVSSGGATIPFKIFLYP
jgi:hypothetical protein